MRELFQILRRHELELATRLVPFEGRRVLEIGGGDGYLASLLDEIATVESIDVYAHPAAVRPVTLYDGRRFPFPDASFDIVFSSSVLEHLTDLDGILAECRRVLKPGGYGVHVVPTTAWRAATSVTHYFALPLYLLRRRRAAAVASGTSGAPRRGLRWFMTHVLFSSRHGEAGNALTELWRFSRRGWLGRFPGWRPSWHPVGLFYSGHLIFGERLPLKARAALGWSSTAVILLRRPEEP